MRTEMEKSVFSSNFSRKWHVLGNFLLGIQDRVEYEQRFQYTSIHASKDNEFAPRNIQ